MSGVDANTINQIELGHRKARPSTTRKLASALGVSAEELERPINWLARHLEQIAEHLDELVETLALAEDALDHGRTDYTRRFLGHVDTGLRLAAEDLHEAHRIETGKNRTAAEKSTDDQLNELIREWEAEKV
jgi:transcriptional regulator with XRE-family HTH domain